MPRRYWVAFPGRPEPVRMDFEALLEGHRGSRFPAGTKVAPVVAARRGSSDVGSQDAEPVAPPLDAEGGRWTPLDELPELRAHADTVAGGPTSLSAQGVVLGELHDGPASASGLTIAAQPQPEPPPRAPAKSKQPWSVPRWLQPVLWITPPLVGIVVLVGWMYGRYSRGAVLEHLPEDCARLDYVDLAALDQHLVAADDRTARSRALKQLGAALEDEGVLSARTAALEVVEHAGLRPYGTIAEAAYCELQRPDEHVVVVGGPFDASSVLGVMREALLRRDPKTTESTYVAQAFEGRPGLRLGNERVAVAAGSHLILLGPPRVVAQLLRARSVARTYGIEREVLVRLTRRAGSSSAAPLYDDERFDVRGERLHVHHRWTLGSAQKDAVAQVRERLVATAQRLRGSSALSGLADGLADANVQARGDDPKGSRELESEHSWALADVRQAVHALVDAERRTSSALVDLLASVQGGDIVRMAVVPGIDYLELRLSPW